jgi:hypothetical protein
VSLEEELATLLCAACTVLGGELCVTYTALVASGKCRGPMPPYLLPAAFGRWDCTRCSRREPGPDAKFCSDCRFPRGVRPTTWGGKRFRSFIEPSE